MKLESGKVDITSLIVKFCELYCKNVTAIILFGSYANGKATEKSDVDIFIIDEACSNGFKVQKRIDGLLLQATIFNFREALNLLCDSGNASHPFFPISYEMSQVLFDKTGQGRYLKEIGTEVLKRGPRSTTSIELETKRISLINYLNDGSSTKYTGTTLAEKLLWGSHVINMCQNYYLSSCNEWALYNQRFKNEVLTRRNPALRDGLHDALNFLIQHNDPNEFANIVKNIMKDYMALSEDSSSPHCSVT